MTRTPKNDKADDLLAFIREYRQAHQGGFPSLREMAAHFNTSVSVISYYLTDNLEKRGLIVTHAKNRRPDAPSRNARTLEIVGLVQITGLFCDKCQEFHDKEGYFSCDHPKRTVIFQEL